MRKALIAVVLALAAAGGGYALAEPGGPDAAAARADGEREGRAAAAEYDSEPCYDRGERHGRREGRKETYRPAFRRAYRRALREESQ